MKHADTLLNALVADGVKLAIVSSRGGGPKTVVNLVELLGWQGLFSEIIGRNTPNAGAKPAPTPALLALERMGVGPEQAAFVGDAPVDMICGKNAGCRARVGLITAAWSRRDLVKGGATHVASSLRDVLEILSSP
jgi:phosphoglycolate phosphatase-like HAD superfamily hydrolase